MGAFGYFWVLVLAAVYQCEGDAYFNDHKNLHPEHSNLDWMKCVPDAKPLSSVSIPGTHQSLKSGGLNVFRNFQAWDLQRQLHAGVRFFDMTLWTFFGKLYVENNAIYHYEKFHHALSQLQIFLQDKKKSETVLLRLTGTGKGIRLAKEELKRPSSVEVWKDRRIPTMAEARGKIVLIQSSDFDWGLPVNAMVLGTEEKEFHLKENIKKASEYCTREMMLTDTGAKGTWEVPRNVAQKLNQQLYGHLSSLKANNKPSCLGIIAMDFPGPKLIQLIIDVTCPLEIGSDQSSDTDLSGVDAPNESTAGSEPPKSESAATPGTPTKPITSSPPKPETSSLPGTPTKPITSSPPGTPTKPMTSSPPGTPTKPISSSPPGTPTKPITSSPPKPETSSPPGTPTKPITSSIPGTPTKPETSPAPKPETSSPPKLETSSPPGTPTKPITSSPPGTPTKPITSSPPGTPTKPITSSPPGTPTKPETKSPPKSETSSPPKPVRRRKKICRRVHRRRKPSPLLS